MEEDKRIADYFVIAGLPNEKDKLKLLDEYSLEVNLKPSAYQDPITDITVGGRLPLTTSAPKPLLISISYPYTR
jgi:hypothetical protein